MENYKMKIKGKDRGLNYPTMSNFCRVFGARTGQTFDMSILFFEKKSACPIVARLLVIDYHGLLLMKSDEMKPFTSMLNLFRSPIRLCQSGAVRFPGIDPCPNMYGDVDCSAIVDRDRFGMMTMCH
jgi:hypothetical protein